MPARSEAQRRFLNARFGHAWTKRHHFDNKGKLPLYARKGDLSDNAQAHNALNSLRRKRKKRQ